MADLNLKLPDPGHRRPAPAAKPDARAPAAPARFPPTIVFGIAGAAFGWAFTRSGEGSFLPLLTSMGAIVGAAAGGYLWPNPTLLEWDDAAGGPGVARGLVILLATWVGQYLFFATYTAIHFVTRSADVPWVLPFVRYAQLWLHRAMHLETLAYLAAYAAVGWFLARKR